MIFLQLDRYALAMLFRRCIHLRQAEPEEIAFYQTLDVCSTVLKLEQSSEPTEDKKAQSLHTAPSDIERKKTSIRSSLGRRHCVMLFVAKFWVDALRLPFSDTVQLPETFAVCRNDPFQYPVVQYIMKNREKGRGVPYQTLKDDLSMFIGMYLWPS